MALDKIIDSVKLDNSLEATADAIREKTGSSNDIVFDFSGETGFAAAISAIPTSPESLEEKDVNFFDYDGTVVAAYTAAEFAELTELPPNPTHSNLTAQGWNWTLSDAKSYVNKYTKLEIGQMFITKSLKTEIDIVLSDGRLSPCMGLGVNGTVTIDWGDNTSPVTLSGTSATTIVYTSIHTYAQAGSYMITITPDSGTIFSIRGDSTMGSALLVKSSTANMYENKPYINAIIEVRYGEGGPYVGVYGFYGCYTLRAISMVNTITQVSTSSFQNCMSLVYLTLPINSTSIGTNCFYGCSTLKSVSFCHNLETLGEASFQNCYSLKNLTLPNGADYLVRSSTFANNYSLTVIHFPSTTGNIYASFPSCRGMKEYHFYSTTPKKMSASGCFSNIPSDCIIYVPYSSDHSVLNAYKTASYWSAYSNYMQEES